MPKNPKGGTKERLGVGPKGPRKKKLPRNGTVPVRLTQFLSVVAPELSTELREAMGEGRPTSKTDLDAAFRKFLRVARGGGGLRSNSTQKKITNFELDGVTAGQRRRQMVREELDAVRTYQRENLADELARINHSCIAVDLERFRVFMQSAIAGPRLTCTGDDVLRRRWQVLHACKMTMGPALWPDEAVVGDVEDTARPVGVDRCAYECVLAIPGKESYRDYFTRTTALRVAATELFDAANPLLMGDEQLCDNMDTALLCITHRTCRAFDLVTTYECCNFHMEPFLGGMNDITSLRRFVYTRHGEAFATTPPHEWGWGDVPGRVARGQFVRILEELLLQNEGLNWAAVQDEYEDVLMEDSKTFPGRGVLAGDRSMTRLPLSGACLMERYRGELAAELMCMVYRVFNADVEVVSEVNRLVNEDEQMPLLPEYDGLAATNTYGDLFDGTKYEEGGIERGRCYVRRLVYTCLRTSWFLHSPIAPSILNALELGASLTGFVDERHADPDTVDSENDEWVDSAGPILQRHREFGIALRNGSAEAESLNAERIMLDAGGNVIQRTSAAAGRCGKRYVTRAVVAVSLVNMWKWKGTIFTSGLVCCLVVDTYGTIYVIKSLGGFVGGIVQQCYIGMDSMLLQPTREFFKRQMEIWIPQAIGEGARRGAEAAGASAKTAEVVGNVAQRGTTLAREGVRVHHSITKSAFRSVYGAFRAGADGLAGISTGAAPSAATAMAVGGSANIGAGLDEGAASPSVEVLTGPAIAIFHPTTDQSSYVGKTFEQRITAEGTPPALRDIWTWPIVGEETQAAATAPPLVAQPPPTRFALLESCDCITMLGAVSAANGTVLEPPLDVGSPIPRVGTAAVESVLMTAVGFASKSLSAPEPLPDADEDGLPDVLNMDSLDRSELEALFGTDGEEKRDVLRRLDPALYRYGTFEVVDRAFTRLQSGAIEPRSYTSAAVNDSVLDLVAPLSSVGLMPHAHALLSRKVDDTAASHEPVFSVPEAHQE